MEIFGIAAVVVAVTLVVLATVMIPTFIEMRKTAVALRESITRSETELTAVLKELHATLADLKAVSGGMAQKVDGVTSFMEEIGATGRSLRSINNVIGTVAALFSTSSAWITGAKVAGNLIVERLTKRKGGN